MGKMPLFILNLLLRPSLILRSKALHTDGGTEYMPVIPILNDSGIIHQLSCPYTPEQNGIAERKHR